MNSEKFHFEKGLNYRIFHIKNPTLKLEDFIIPFPCFILCTNGTAKISYNSEIYHIKKDTLLCIAPNTTSRGLDVSDDFQGIVILFSSDALIDSTIGIKADYLTTIFMHPEKSLTDDPQSKRIITNLFDILDTYNNLEEKYVHNSDFVYGIIRCLILTVAEISKHVLDKNAFAGAGFSTTDNYFREFLRLLSSHCKTQHNVAFYADKLCITPKYLNEICRKKTKKTAKEVITRSVITQIKSALIVSGTSVQRIAYDFNFCDQSSFGKYFKKAVGIAPMAFRNKHIENLELNDD